MSEATLKFIEKARKIHGDKYDYSLVVYINSFTKVKIKCKKHNIIFEQTPNAHLQGRGCIKCYHEGRRLTLDEFIEKAIKKHGPDRYDYSLVVYQYSYVKITIICNKCGHIFEQEPNCHLNGCGCPICKNKDRAYSTKEYIKKALIKHGNLYDYSLVEYKNKRTKIKIKCNKCGHIFEQRPDCHLRGQGCPECARANTRSNKEEFIKKAEKIHGKGKYDYSEVEYINSTTKVKIKCNKCGNFFMQTPSVHLGNHGCPHCLAYSQKSKGEIELAKYIKSVYKGNIFENKRDLLGNKMEIDIYLPELNLAFEYNGEHWHKLKEIEHPGCHENKRKRCKDRGIQLIEISDIKWRKNKSLIKKEIIDTIENLTILKDE